MTAEYCYSDIRDRIMILQESFVPIAQILTALLSWGVLVNNWEVELFPEYIRLHAWNFYLLICSLFSLMAFVLYSFIPESPRFLLNIKKHDEAREVLLKVYTFNTGKPAETYAYTHIWRDKEKVENRVCKKSIAQQFAAGFRKMTPIFKKPLGPALALICILEFICMKTFNVIRLWYPQLSTIIENHEIDHLSKEPSDLCVMIDAYTSSLNRVNNFTNSSIECFVTRTGTETYINTIILGCVCFVPFLVSGLLIKKVAKKYLICVCGLMTTACTLALRWAASKPLMVSLFSIDVALTQLLACLFHNYIVEFFPTSVRSFAVAIAMELGRLGTLIGNIAFPMLLKIGCVVPFFALAGMMLVFSGVALLLPRNGNP